MRERSTARRLTLEAQDAAGRKSVGRIRQDIYANIAAESPCRTYSADNYRDTRVNWHFGRRSESVSQS